MSIGSENGMQNYLRKSGLVWSWCLFSVDIFI